MGFFNIGAGELFLVLILIMLVFGPQRLPELARKVGKGVRDLRDFASNIDPELLEDFRDITRDIQSVRNEMSTIRSDLGEIQRDLAGAAKEMSDSVGEAVDGVKDAATAVSSSTPSLATIAGTPAAAASGGAAVSAASHSGGTASAVGPAPAGTGAATPVAARGPATSPVAVSSARAAAQPVDFEGEIIGTVLSLKGGGIFLDEIIGAKTLPLPRSAAHARAPELSDGHDADVILRSRHALMASLVHQRRLPQARRLAVPGRPSQCPQRSAPARSRRTRRG